MIQTTIRLPEKLHEQIKKEAKEEGVSINSLIITALWKGKRKSERR